MDTSVDTLKTKCVHSVSTGHILTRSYMKTQIK